MRSFLSMILLWSKQHANIKLGILFKSQFVKGFFKILHIPFKILNECSIIIHIDDSLKLNSLYSLRSWTLSQVTNKFLSPIYHASAIVNSLISTTSISIIFSLNHLDTITSLKWLNIKSILELCIDPEMLTKTSINWALLSIMAWTIIE